MVAFSGSDPIGVLIGAKRPSGTLVHRIAVHPDHRRQGHGRHLLASLGSKLGILGPPRIVAEVPETFDAARELFCVSGYVEEATLTDYVLRREDGDPQLDDRNRLVIPVTVDDLAANGLIGGDPPSPVASAGEVPPCGCWERSTETLTAKKDEIAGLAVATDERIEAWLLYIKDGVPGTIVALRSLIDDGGARLKHLLSRLGSGTFRFPKVNPAEPSRKCLETLGFRPAGQYRLYAGTARSN
jgi:hypothetical protein